MPIRRTTRRRRLNSAIVPRDVNAVGSTLFQTAASRVGRAFSNRVKSDAINPKSTTSLERKMGMRKYSTTSRAFTYKPSTVVRSSGKEQSKYTSTYGKSKMVTFKKLVSMQVPQRVLRFQGIKLADAGSGLAGKFAVSNRIALASTNELAPLYAICLSGTVQGSNGPTVLRQARLHSTGRVSWDSVNGLDNLNVNNGTWYLEKSLVGSEVSDSFQFVEPAWYNIKLNLYGTKTQQTTYIIEYIQCNHDFSAIEDESDVLITASGSHGEHYRDNIYGYWQNRLKALMTNPIAGSQTSHYTSKRAQPYKVLKSWRYVIAPHQTIESDTSPNNCVVNLFIHDHRMINHCWSGPSGSYDSTNVDVATGIDDKVTDPNIRTRDSPTNAIVNPSPRQRRYIIVRAVNTTRIPSASESDDNTPSFDLVVRKSERLGVHQ